MINDAAEILFRLVKNDRPVWTPNASSTSHITSLGVCILPFSTHYADKKSNWSTNKLGKNLRQHEMFKNSKNDVYKKEA